MNQTTQTQLVPFVRAYLVTALWSSLNDDGSPMDQEFSIHDFDSGTLQRAVADCDAFRAKADDIISAAIETGLVKCGPDFDEYGRAAHDFWLTRNGHGAGFWDGDWPEPMASQLTEIAKGFGVCEIYIGDNGKLYFS